MKIGIRAIGKIKGSEAEWCAEYQKRLQAQIEIREWPALKNLTPDAAQKAEADKLLTDLPAKRVLVLLDEGGKDLTSREFAKKLAQWQERGQIVFIIGGANGVTESIKRDADFTLAFGRATWPHRMVRVMLLEQLYRAQQIAASHPYHRD